MGHSPCQRNILSTLEKRVDWNYDPKTYVEGNYERLIIEDRRLGRLAVGAMRDRAQFGTLKRAIHIGMGAVPRGSALMAPFMDTVENGAEIVMGDIGEIKLAASRELILQLEIGNLGIWQAHEDAMVEADPYWKGSFQAAGRLGKVVELSMYDLEENEYDIGSGEFVFESATRKRKRWRQSFRTFMKSVKPGGVVHMAYVNGSEGYNVKTQELPAYPVTNDEVLDVAEEELEDIEQYFTSASGHMREDGDPHKNRGLGVLVGTRKGA